jgi:L-fucose isomerase
MADAAVLLRKARQVLESLGAEVVDPGEPTSERPQAARHGHLLRRQGAQVLVNYIGHWTHAHTVLVAVMAAQVPVVIWSDLRPGGTNLTGVGAVRGALDEVGIANSLVMGGFDDPATMAELGVRCRAASVVERLRGQVFGLMGQRSMGMVTSTIDPSGWYSQFGIDVDDWDMLETVELGRAIRDDDPRVHRYMDWMYEAFGKVAVTRETLLASIKLYLVSKEIVETRGYDFVAVKCLPYMPSIYTTFCFAVAMLNDDSDADGPKKRTVCACESDANGALTMQIMKHLNGGPVNFGDIFEVDPETRIVTIANCGSQSTQLAPSRKDVNWLPNEMVQFDWLINGMCPQYTGKAGRVTLARLSRVKDEYVMLITGGEALERLGESVGFAPFCPRTYVKLDCDIAGLLQNLRSNHVSAIYGDYVSDLIEVCRLANIKPIVLEPVTG